MEHTDRNYYNNWSGYRPHQVQHTNNADGTAVRVHAVGFRWFDDKLSVFHELRVHWTRAFDILHLHGSPEIECVYWRNPEGREVRSFAKWWFTPVAPSSDQGTYRITTIAGTPLLAEQLMTCEKCGHVDTPNGMLRGVINAVRLRDGSYVCDNCHMRGA